MSYGILAYNNSGKILISTDIQGLHFAGSATYLNSTQSLTTNFPNYAIDGSFLSGSWIHYFNITLPNASNPVFFIRPKNTIYQYGIIKQYIGGLNVWNVDIIQNGTSSYPPEVYAFTTAAYARLDANAGLQLDTTGPGIITYLSDGITVGFDSRKDPLGILWADQNVYPPQLPSDGGAPVTETSYPHAWQDQNLDFNFKSDNTYNSYYHGITDPSADLMFSAPSTAQSVRTRVKGGYKNSKGQTHYSTAQWWVFYIQTYGLRSNNTLIAGWTPYKAGYFYHQEFSSGGWFGSDSGQMSQGSRPYPDKTINWINNTAMITNANYYIITPSWAIIPLYGVYDLLENDSYTMFVGGARVPDGTYYWTIKHITTNNSDFVAVSGSINVYVYGLFDIQPREDNVFEGPQTFQVELRKNSTSGIIVKTSDIFTIRERPGYAWADYPTTVNEGPVSFSISTTNVPSGTVLYWFLYIDTTEAADYTAISGSFTINSAGQGIFTVPLLADNLTEGTEQFRVSVSLLDPSTSYNYWFYIVLVGPNDVIVTDSSQEYSGGGGGGGGGGAVTLGYNNGNIINVEGYNYTPDTSIIILNTNGTIDYYSDNSGGTAPTTWFSPTTAGGSSSFEFKIIANSIPNSCTLSYGRISSATGSHGPIGSSWDSGWWDLNGYMGFVQFYNGGMVDRTMTGTLYIRDKNNAAIQIGKSITMKSYANPY